MRITTDLLHARAQHTARAIGCPPDLRDVAAPGYTPGTLRLRRDDAGWQLLLIVNDGGGAESLAYALTGRDGRVPARPWFRPCRVPHDR